MDAIFPLGFPAATAFYLALYVATLALHVVFVHYVLAGSVYLTVDQVRRAPARDSQPDAPAELLRDWMPFALSAAITAGIAPLLFVQILYKQPFYTANLLLLHDWMAIVPVLIIAFYLLYLLKARFAEGRGVWRAAAAVGAAACVLFVAFSWSRNHLLMLRQDVWGDMYASESMGFDDPRVWPRLAVLGLASLPTLAMWLAWQIRGYANRGRFDRGQVAHAARRLAGIAISGVLLTVGAAAWCASADPGLSAAALGPMARMYFVAAVVGLALQAGLWVVVYRLQKLPPGPVGVITLANVGTILSATVVREAVRLQSVDIAVLYPEHAQAAVVGGLVTFLVFATFNVVAVGYCLRAAAHAVRVPSVRSGASGLAKEAHTGRR